MLYRTIARLAISPYAIFLKRTAKQFPLSAFKGSNRAQLKARGRAVAAAYRALSKSDKTRLEAAAKRAPKPKPRTPVKRRPNVYAKFVRANFHKVKKLAPHKRLAALAKLWRA